MSSDKKLGTNRPVERDAVNSVRYFFEHHNVPFFEVDLRVDFGKDIVIEVVEENVSTGLWVGLQVKGGEQTYRRSAGGRIRGIPYSAKDCKSFRSSNIPVLGVVRTHSERFDEFLWVNLQRVCQEVHEYLGEDRGGFAESVRPLNAYNLIAFLEEMRRVAASDGNSPVLQLASRDAEVQQQAIFDCFVLARSDPRPMIIARRLLHSLSKDAVGTLIAALAPVVGHGDIFYHPRNILPQSNRTAIADELRWNRDDMALLLEFINEEDEEEMWGRGTFGQHICAIVSQPPNALLSLIRLAESRKEHSKLARKRAYILALYLSRDGAPQVSSRILRYSHDLASDDYVQEAAAHVREYGCFELY